MPYNLPYNVFGEALAWTLFHSIWQAALLLGVLVLILILARKITSRLRYYMAYSIMLASVVWSIQTFVDTYQHVQHRQEIKEQIYLNQQDLDIHVAQILANPETLKTQAIKPNQIKWLEAKAKISPFLPIGLLIWAFGALLMLLRLSGSWIQILRYGNRYSTPLDTFWEEKITLFAAQLNIKRKVSGLISYKAKVPMVIGHFKPIVLIPASLLSGIPSEQLEAIIAHELAHIKRHDFALNFIQSIIESFLFFNPAIWIISKLVRDEREYSCDELALEITDDKLNYIKALASAQDFANSSYKAVAFANRSGSLLSRVKYLKTIHHMKSKLSAGFYAATLILTGTLFLSFTLIKPQSPEKIDGYLQQTTEANEQPISLDYSELKANIQQTKDSIKQHMEELEEVPEELNVVLEMALMEENMELSAQIMESVEMAMEKIDFKAIEELSLKEAQLALEELNMDSTINAAMEAIDFKAIEELSLKEAELALEKINLDSLLNESMKEAKIEIKLAEKEMEAMKIEMENFKLEAFQIDEITKEAMEQAAEEIRNLNIDSIVNISIKESMRVIEEINIQEIVNDALEDMETQDMDSAAKEKRLKQMEEELNALEEKK